MKKLLVMMLMVAMSMAMLAGCTSDAENANGTDASDAVSSETAENISEEASDVPETDATTDITSETTDTSSEEETEAVEEVVMYSADEVMAHIDTLIAQYQYNDPEHIKALVIAANLDYISEEDLDTILSTYGYTIEELAVVYDECILDNAVALQESLAYSQGQIDSLSDENTYKNRITLESVMLNEADAEEAKWYDTMLVMRSLGRDDANGRNNTDDMIDFSEKVLVVNDNDLNAFERTCYSYTYGILSNELSYIDYLNNPFVAYSK